jgi:hypothetical protein
MPDGQNERISFWVGFTMGARKGGRFEKYKNKI